MMLKQSCWIAILVCWNVYAEIKVEGAKFRPLNIAIPEANTNPNTRDSAVLLTKVIRNDLDFSGVFSLLDSKSFLSSSKDPVNIKAWQQINAEAVLMLNVYNDKHARIICDAQIVPIGSSKGIRKITYQTQKSDVRDLAHKIANDVYKYFTGEDGVFLTKIAAVKEQGLNRHLVVMDFDGENIKQITKGDAVNILPSYSADGQKIMYTVLKGATAALYELNLKTMATRVLSAKEGLNMGANASPNKNAIALTLSYEGASRVYAMDTNGGNVRRLTPGGAGLDLSPSYNADGSKITFVSSRSGNPHIYVMNADGSEQKRITFQGKYNQTPRFSRRVGDSNIVFMGRDEFYVFDIFLLDSETKKITRVTQDQGRNEDPSFAPNGRLIVFSSNRSGKRSLYVSNLDGSKQRQITNNGIYATPSWGPIVN